MQITVNVPTLTYYWLAHTLLMNFPLFNRLTAKFACKQYEVLFSTP